VIYLSPSLPILEQAAKYAMCVFVLYTEKKVFSICDYNYMVK